MGGPWFRRAGWLHYPVSTLGVVATLAAVAFCANVFIAIDRHSHSASDTLYGIFPFFACTFLLHDWLARNTCERGGQP
jgi:hypothetical protein